MKKLLSIILLTLTSCYYYPPVPPPVYTYGTYYMQPPQRDCTCGYVLEKGVDDYGKYFLDVQNQCSGNVKRFVFDKEDWFDYKVSDGICLVRNSSW